MSREVPPFVFPSETRFFRIDGVVFASIDGERWCAVDACGHLIVLTSAYAEELSRMEEVTEVIDEAAFRREFTACSPATALAVGLLDRKMP